MLSLAEIQLEGRAFLRFEGKDEIGVDIHTFGFSLDLPIHGSILIIMSQESQTNIFN